MIDPDIAGRVLETVQLPVERSKLYELARALRDDDPIWHDHDAARGAGFDEVPMLPTVTVLADHWRECGALSAAYAIGADIKRLLHGEAAWEYLDEVRVGDELTATTRVTDVSTRQGKRGGTMILVAIETTYTNQHGATVARRRDTLIETETAG